MHRVKGIVLAAGTFISFVSTAGAMPLAPLDHGQSGFVVQVEGGCGPVSIVVLSVAVVPIGLWWLHPQHRLS